MTLFRAKVQLLCKDYASSLTARDFVTAQNLSCLATSTYDAAVSTRNEGELHEKPLLLVHDALYHQCQITLHSMAVPLFSGMPIDPDIFPETRRTSARTVTRHADLFEDLLKPYLYGRSDITCLPPLVGYGAFITGIVHLASELSCPSREKHGAPAGTRGTGCKIAAVEAILHLLDRTRVYWRALQQPVSIVLASAHRNEVDNGLLKWEKLQAALHADLSKYRNSSRAIGTRDGMSATQNITACYRAANVPQPTNSLEDVKNLINRCNCRTTSRKNWPLPSENQAISDSNNTPRHRSRELVTQWQLEPTCCKTTIGTVCLSRKPELNSLLVLNRTTSSSKAGVLSVKLHRLRRFCQHFYAL